jgi:hypothetical protein
MDKTRRSPKSCVGPLELVLNSLDEVIDQIRREMAGG